MLEQEWLVGQVIFNSGFCLGEFNVQLYHWREKIATRGLLADFFQLYLYINLYQDSIWAYYHLKAWKNNPDPQLPWINWSNWQSENLGWFDIHDPIDGFGPQKKSTSLQSTITPKHKHSRHFGKNSVLNPPFGGCSKNWSQCNLPITSNSQIIT